MPAATVAALVRSDPSGEVRAAAATGLGRFMYLATIHELSERDAQTVHDALLAQEARSLGFADEEVVDLDARISVQKARLESGQKLLSQAKSLDDLVMLDRERVGREASPSAAVIDSQSVKTTEAGGPRGYEPARKSTGASVTPWSIPTAEG